jgi:hypothetical protein
MKRLFLYQLGRHSIPAIAAAILFIICYSVLFSKKMDMALFPYNRMFATVPENNRSSKVYAVKLNGNRIGYTKYLYWKKDFLEQAATKFALYQKNDHKNFMDIYLAQKIGDTGYRNLLAERLTPQQPILEKWAIWYCGFAGHKSTAGSVVSLMEYSLNFDLPKPYLQDSTEITSIIISK